MSNAPSEASLAESRDKVLRILEFEDGAAGGGDSFPKAGDEVGEFRIVREIGRGGMGVVYLAERQGGSQRVALKLLPLGPLDRSPERMQRIEREGRILASLEHPSVVAVHATGTLPGYCYVAMKFVDGSSLRELMLQSRTGAPTAPGGMGWMPFVVHALHHVAQALAAAHDKGVIHRDLKPENVLVDESGNPVLVDFGLAREDHRSGATITQGFVGTPRYASPEQARGEPLDARSDVFSFGAMAFELVTGSAPFDGSTSQELLAAIQQRRPRWPRGVPVPEQLQLVIEKCLDKRPDKRYANASELVGELERVQRFEPVHAMANRPWRQRWGGARQRTWLTAALALLPIALLAGALAWHFHGQWQAAKGSELLRAAQQQLRAGDLEGARHSLDRAAAHPTAATGATGLRADLHLWDAEWQPALAAYVRIAEPTRADLLGAALAAFHADGASGELTADFFEDPADAREHLLAAMGHRVRGDPSAALRVLDHGLAAHGGDYLLHKLRAVVREQAGRKEDALADLLVVRALRPADLRSVREAGWILFDLGRKGEQEALLRRTLESHPDHPLLLADLSLSLYPRFRREQGIEIARRAVELAPQQIWPRCALARNLIWYEEYEEARAVLDQAMANFPGEPSLVLEQARLEVKGGDADAGLALLDGLRPEAGWRMQVMIVSLEAQAHYRKQDFELALAAYRELADGDPEHPDWHFQAGRCLENLDRPTDAQPLFEKALELDPRRAEYLFPFARMHSQQGHYREALDLYYRAFALDPEDPLSLYWVARTWRDMQRADVAIEYLPAILEKYPRWDYAWTLKAECESKLNRLKEAEESYRIAFDLGLESHAYIRADYADVLYRQGKDREALEEFRRARDIDHECPTAWCGEGLVYLRSRDSELRDPAKALPLLRRALELLPAEREYQRYVSEAEEALARSPD